jgi:phosphatidylserine/phosphatidylglycerophosphate/cardiolipin synthase-like enzyme
VNNSGLPGAYGLKIGRLRYPGYRSSDASGTGPPSWVVTTDPELGHYNYRGVFLAAVAAARKNIYIENAFFTDALLGRLIVRKAKEFRGRVDCGGLSEYECAQKMRDAVPIHLVLPDATDQPMLDVVGHAYVHEMRHLGVKIYRWNPGRPWSATKMMHTKAWLVDYEEGQAGLAYLGSANATQRSHISDNEMGIVSASPEFARQLHEQLFCGDMRGDARLEGTEKFHVTWTTKRRARMGRGLRQLLVNVLWLF